MGNPLFKNIALWIVIGVILMIVFGKNDNFTQGGLSPPTYDRMISEARDDQLTEIRISGSVAHVTPKSGPRYEVAIPLDNQIMLMKELEGFGVRVRYTGTPFWMSFVMSWLPMFALLGLWIYFMRKQMGGGAGGGGLFGFGKSKARVLDVQSNPTTFADVAGCDEAKEEVAELVDFLRDPSKFTKLGGRIPRGVLMVGSPGTGKTLLARAIAGEAKVPFFSISGSDFVEMFVGVGAARVRDMFEQAKKHPSCIIFIDEIDAVGRHRGAGLGGGNDEREQTLNQLLVQMDGFESTSGVIVIAASNRPDVLDPALLRPGRFDRQVVVPLPDIRGREEILKVHMRKVPLDPDVDASVIARGTPGFSGADIANLVNEAALFAARGSKRHVDMHDFERAKEKIMMGPERRSMIMPMTERVNTAWHEMGHAIVAASIPGTDPVHKVTIMPRGRALGLTLQLPEEDRYSHSKAYLESLIAILFGGRIAEEMRGGADAVTTGASNDFARASELARKMVTKWGMSSAIGPVVYGGEEREVFLGKTFTETSDVSPETQRQIDIEVKRLIDMQYQRARSILDAHRSEIEAGVAALLEWETIDAEQFEAIMAGRAPEPPRHLRKAKPEDHTPIDAPSDHSEPPASPDAESRG